VKETARGLCPFFWYLPWERCGHQWAHRATKNTRRRFEWQLVTNF